MEDTFGRLPSDTLKYMCLLSIVPEFTLVLEENTYFIKIQLPLIGFSYSFSLKINENNRIIILDEMNIVFYTEHCNLVLDIKYLKLLQNVLEEYKKLLEKI